MTQRNGAQPLTQQLAWKPDDDARTLAQRRADFEAQMRAMALADLAAVAARLKQLHKRLEQETGRKWTQQEIALQAKVAYRSLQGWEEGAHENTSGKGYDALAKFYRRKLGDKSITRKWIVFGDQEPVEEPGAPAKTVLSEEDSERLKRIEKDLRELLKRTAPPEEPDRVPPPEEELGDEPLPQTPRPDEEDTAEAETG